MTRTLAPPPDPPRLTPNPEQIADPWREVVDPKKHKWIRLGTRSSRSALTTLDSISQRQAHPRSGTDPMLSATTPGGRQRPSVLAPRRQIPSPIVIKGVVRISAGGDYERGAHARLVFMNLDKWPAPDFTLAARTLAIVA
jgi:hypothetical protein